MSKTIFITGTSKGFGRIWTETFLEQGYKVAATARNLDSLQDLVQTYGDFILPIKLDVNDREACFNAVEKAKEHFGSIDVIINNAGYGLFGAIEETTEKEARDQIETNVFGLLWITQAVIPIMRAQGYGHIIQVSSVLGIVSPPVVGLYNASKFAVEAISESLSAEVKGFGINVTIVEPNSFGTDWSGPSAIHTQANPVYDEVKKAFFGSFTEDSIGIPEATKNAILKLVNSPMPPLRLILGKVAYPWIKQTYEQRLAVWDEWKEISAEAHGK
jgi:NADP-dependent 3-hydroxy acid dehydrogenase YdfG